MSHRQSRWFTGCNYKQGKSDIDILGVVSRDISDEERNALAKAIDHAQMPCPAKGLDLVLARRESIVKIVEVPFYEFRFSTGGSWRNEGWEKGHSSEMCILIELCRRHGMTVYGKEPHTYFAHIDKRLIVRAFLEMLYWHQTNILDDFHDPHGQYSVLNACRALAFVREDRFFSKTEGGEWLLQQEPDNEVVRKAIAIRNGSTVVDVSAPAIGSFLARIIAELEAEHVQECPRNSDPMKRENSSTAS